jgi:hypothetical protein
MPKCHKLESARALGFLILGGSKYWNLVLQVGGVSKIETIKYALASLGPTSTNP